MRPNILLDCSRRARTSSSVSSAESEDGSRTNSKQSVVGAQRPLVQSGMGGERGPIGLVMDQIFREKVIYFARCSVGQARPKQIRIGGNLVANAAPVRLKFVKGENRARLGPALHLRVKIVAQPEQQSFVEGHSLQFLERSGDPQGRTNRDHDAGCLLHLPQHREPKRRKTANTRVFDYRQGRAAELRLEENRPPSRPDGRPTFANWRALSKRP